MSRCLVSDFPIVDLPAPIMPTSTIERIPSAEVISASWGVLAGTGTAVSDIKKLGCWRILSAPGQPILPPPIPLPETLATKRGTCRYSGSATPDDFNG